MATWPSALLALRAYIAMYCNICIAADSNTIEQRICFDSDKDIRRYLVRPWFSLIFHVLAVSCYILPYFSQLSGSQQHSTVSQRTFLVGIVLMCITDHERNLDNTWTFLLMSLSWLVRPGFNRFVHTPCHCHLWNASIGLCHHPSWNTPLDKTHLQESNFPK